MSPTTTPLTIPPKLSHEVDTLTDNLVKSLKLARTMQMPLIERLLEMSLIEIGHAIAAQQKSARDQGLN